MCGEMNRQKAFQKRTFTELDSWAWNKEELRMTFRFIYTNSNGGIVIYGSDFDSWVISFLLDLISLGT